MITFEKIYLPDTNEVRTLLDSVWEDTYVDCLTPHAMKRINNNWQSLTKITTVENSEVFCSAAFDEHGVVGIAIAYKKGENVEIKRLYVLPDQQGRGIGKQLLAGILQAFQNIKKVELLVEVQNAPTIAFYKKHSFTLKEEVEKERDGEKIHLQKMEISLK